MVALLALTMAPLLQNSLQNSSQRSYSGAIRTIICPADIRSRPESVSLTRRLRQLGAEFNVPGGAFIVAKDSKVESAASFGVIQAGSSVQTTLDTPVPIASMTLSLLGLLTVRLAQEGKVNIVATLGETFPELASQLDSRIAKANLYDLCTCASGLPGGWNYDEIRKREKILPLTTARYQVFAEYVSKMAYLEPRAEVDSHGGPNTYALVAALEKLTGQSFEDLVVEHVVKPLRMSSFGFGYPIDGKRLFGVGNNELVGNSVRAKGFEYPTLVGMYASTKDLLQLAQSMVPASAGGANYISDRWLAIVLRRNQLSPFSPAGRYNPNSGELYMAGDPGGQYANIKANVRSGMVLAGFLNLSADEGGMTPMLRLISEAEASR
jgi:CubicO group peptidase (beta-lactamase class C family)